VTAETLKKAAAVLVGDRRRQGLPSRIRDSSTIGAIAAVIRDNMPEVQKRKTTRATNASRQGDRRVPASHRS
jgi:hypothetical protein